MQQEPARELSIAAANARVARLSFERIPNQSRLFLDYQSNPRSLARYYPNAAGKVDDLKTFAGEVLRKYPPHRAAVCDALMEVNTAINAGPASMKNLERLRADRSVAVVTGQQAGLFTGPLYTVYKALSAARLAVRLTESGVEAVPVFWAATEDHDFAEVANASVAGESDELVKLEYKPVDQPEASPVGLIELETGITSLVDEMFSELPKTEFSAELHRSLSSAWSPAESFGTAFLKTLASALADFGIVFIDPMQPAIKKLCAPIYLEAFAKRDEIVDEIIERSTELGEKGYHSQVVVGAHYVPLFWHTDDGQRVGLRKSGEGPFQAARLRTDFSSERLATLISDEPERFSPGVMLRPVVQDWLLPTICYLGGAAEVAYFAQNSVVYEVLNRPVTPILHRQSFSVVEARHGRTLKKYELRLVDLFAGLEQTLLRLAEQTLAPEAAAAFANAEDRIIIELSRLSDVVSHIDSPLADNLAKRRRKIMYHIAAIERKSLLAAARGDEDLHRRIRALFASLLPNGALQERSVNVFQYLNKFGPQFVHWIYEAIDLDDREHRIIEL